ncbi:MAG: hypothetical protein ABFR47_03180 [Verrucomicrobiota bacterium]
MTLTQKWMTTALLVSFMASGALWLKGRGLSGRQERIRHEIEAIESRTAEIRLTLPELRDLACEVLEQSGWMFALADGAESWCTQLFCELYIERGLNMEFTVRGLELPFGMDTPWGFRQIGAHVYPGLAPCSVKVKLSGSLFGIVAFLKEAERHNRSMVVSRLELVPEEQGDRFEGTATLVFPQLFYAEDLILIQQFAQE